MDKLAEFSRRLAARVGGLRAARGLSLAALAGRSGVSRSMLSVIERGASSPTAAVLAKVAAGLGVPLGALFEAAAPAAPRRPVARRAEQPAWRDPGSGYRRRNVTPAGADQPVQLVEVHFPARARVAFDNGGTLAPLRQQVWVLAGAMEVATGGARHRLAAGDCLAMRLDRPVVFHNPGRSAARYVVAVEVPPGGAA